MKLYNREKEISQLTEIQKLSLKNAQFNVVTGRRRIGKTYLLLHATAGQYTLYFFVARKAESYLCQDFQQEIQDKLGIPILGKISSFGKLFEYLMHHSKERPFNLIIDEFQELRRIISRGYSTYSGKILERYFRKKLIEEKGITMIGGYWDRKGEFEIDLVTLNEIDKRATGRLKDFKITFRSLSMNDM